LITDCIHYYFSFRYYFFILHYAMPCRHYAAAIAIIYADIIAILPFHFFIIFAMLLLLR